MCGISWNLCSDRCERRVAGYWETPACIVCEMPVQDIQAVTRHDGDDELHDGDWPERACGVDEEAAP